jgi:hypothetical protein
MPIPKLRSGWGRIKMYGSASGTGSSAADYEKREERKVTALVSSTS